MIFGGLSALACAVTNTYIILKPSSINTGNALYTGGVGDKIQSAVSQVLKIVYSFFHVETYIYASQTNVFHHNPR